MGSELPLEGITVVSCEQAVAAPFASRQLADLGARVIKVERPGSGDFARDYDEAVNGLSSHFVWLNRSKESIALDLKQPESIEIMYRLLSEADVFIQNFAPSAAERLGLGADELRRRFPTLITCSISGYGTSGPYRDAKAYDLLIQSETGLVSITGSEDEPAKTGIPTADIGAGMYAFAGLLAALYNRERTGEGAHVEISLFDSLLEWMGYPLYYTEYGGKQPSRAGTSHAAIAPYGTYTACDGTEIVLSIQNQREWQSFCETVLQLPHTAVDGRFDTGTRRVANRSDLDCIVTGVFGSHGGEEMEQRLQKAKIAHARLRPVAEVLTHPQLIARDRWRTVETPAGPVKALLPAITLSGHTPRMDPVPDVGQHTEAILESIGYDNTARSNLERAGIY
jgi:itaconate CoA-transferase